MGLISNIFGSNDTDTSAEQAMLAEEQKKTAEEEERLRKLQQDQDQANFEYKQRGSGQRGGGRTGLMFGGSQQGVV